MALDREEYEEPRCLLNMHPERVNIPVMRVIDKLDEYLGSHDYDGAERHLQYWLREAEAFHDHRGKLTVLNEMIGLYRKMGKETEGLSAIDEALALMNTLDMEGTIGMGTTLVNAATGLKSFGKADEAMPLYAKAKTLYESLLSPEDERLGGLYNNMALAMTELGLYSEAGALFRKALEVMEKQEHGEAEMAITYLNMADLMNAQGVEERQGLLIEKYLDRAERLLETDTLPRNGYYAFVCEKCAPIFGFYGRFAEEAELKTRAEAIYARS